MPKDASDKLLAKTGHKWTYLGQALCGDDEYRDCYVKQKHIKGYPRNWLHKPVWINGETRIARVWWVEMETFIYGNIGPDFKFITTTAIFQNTTKK